MAYNMSGVEASQNILDLFVAMNTMSGNVIVYMTLIGFWTVLFMVLLRNNPPAESILTASATSGFVSMLFIGAGILDPIWLFGFAVIAGISAVSLYINR